MVEPIFLLLLMFAQLPVIILIGLFCTGWRGASFLCQTIVLLTFEIIVNVALKGTFKVPLAPALHKIGYAFPSGHMQFATVFYVWLMLWFPVWWWRCVGSLLLGGIASALMHYGYHDGMDVLGGGLCGVGLVVVYQVGVKHIKQWPLYIVGLASCLMAYTEWTAHAAPHLHAWVAYGILCVSIGWKMFKGDCWAKAHPTPHF